MAGILVGLTLERFPARDSQELCVALTLADAADVDGSNVFPSVARVARLARCSDRAVQYALQRFREVGFLVVVSLGGGRGRPTRYRIDREWLEVQPSVLPYSKGAQVAPIQKTMQTPCKNGAISEGKGCTNGAPVGAPNPLPAYPLPTTSGVGGGVLEELLEAAEKAALTGRKPIDKPQAWRAAVRKRLTETGPTVDDLVALDNLRSKRDIERTAVQLVDGDYLTPAGSRFRVCNGFAHIQTIDGRVEVQPAFIIARLISGGHLTLLPAIPGS